MKAKSRTRQPKVELTPDLIAAIVQKVVEGLVGSGTIGRGRYQAQRPIASLSGDEPFDEPSESSVAPAEAAFLPNEDAVNEPCIWLPPVERVTLKDVRSWETWASPYVRENRLFTGPDVTVPQILAAPLPNYTRLWLVLRRDLLTLKELRAFACACADRALDRARVAIIDASWTSQVMAAQVKCRGVLEIVEGCASEEALPFSFAVEAAYCQYVEARDVLLAACPESALVQWAVYAVEWTLCAEARKAAVESAICAELSAMSTVDPIVDADFPSEGPQWVELRKSDPAKYAAAIAAEKLAAEAATQEREWQVDWLLHNYTAAHPAAVGEQKGHA